MDFKNLMVNCFLCSLARLPIGRGVRARRYKMTTTSMTTGSNGNGQSPSNQNEINNNSRALNAENNNEDSVSLSDEENTSEYGQSPGLDQLQNPLNEISNLSGDGVAEEELSNRLNNNSKKNSSSKVGVLASSTDSENILNNNEVQEVVGGDDNATTGLQQTGLEKDKNHNRVVQQQMLVK